MSIMESIKNNYSEEYEGATKYFMCQSEKLWFIPEIMKLSSDPIKIMLEGEFLEKYKREISIPDEELVPMIHILNSLTPRLPLKDIDENNVEVVIPVAHKYFIRPILEKCKIFLCEKFTGDPIRAFTAFCIGVKYRFTEVISESIPLMLFSQNEGLMHKLEKLDIVKLMPKSLCVWMATSFWFCNASDYWQSEEYPDLGAKMEVIDCDDGMHCIICWHQSSEAVRYEIVQEAMSMYDPVTNPSDSDYPLEMQVLFPMCNREIGKMLTASCKRKFNCRCCDVIYCLDHCKDDKCTNLKEVITMKLPKMPDDWYSEQV